MSVDQILNRPSLEEINALFHERYGDKGVEVYTNFTTHSHELIPHGGAPRSNFLAEYFLRRALGHPGSSPERDYTALRGQFASANQHRKPGECIHTPTKKLLAKATCPPIRKLITLDNTPSQNNAPHARAA